MCYIFKCSYIKNTYYKIFFPFIRSDCLPEGRAACRLVYGLTKDQIELCYKASDVTAAALEGLDIAITECQIQVSFFSLILNILQFQILPVSME